MNDLVETGSFSLAPQSLEEAFRFADMLAGSDLVPKDFQKKPGNILVAMQWGAEIGLKPLQAMQNIAVINGRPSLWGDAVLALVRSSPVCEYVIETDDGRQATCRVKRKGEPEQVRTFSVDDAKTAGLFGKTGPWTTNPKRMRQMRARAFALRDVFTDVLKGMPIAEEVMDLPRDMGPVDFGNVPNASPLVGEGETEAAKGLEAYQQFWQRIGPDNRKSLASEHERLKDIAIQADKARTVDSREPGSDDDFVAAMDAAEGDA